MLDSPNS